MSKLNLRVICLGAGVQSSALYIMACEGAFEHEPDVAIFADTGDEPNDVYEHLKWMMMAYSDSIPIVVAQRVGLPLIEDTFRVIEKTGVSRITIPMYVVGGDGSRGFTFRMCTKEFKIEPIIKEIRRWLGFKPGERIKGKAQVEQWFGISTDEAHRMKSSHIPWITNRYPLIEKGMSRGDCARFLEERGVTPVKSACVVCPFHNDRHWLEMKRDSPDDFEHACWFDDRLREYYHAGNTALKGEPFIHPARIPLREVKFRHENQLDLFGNECEGMCGT